MSEEGEKTCPLCAEEMDLTDQQLKPCKCGYEVCVWCWHHIMEMAEKDETDGRCPACRTPYDKEKIVGTASKSERLVAEISMEKKKSQKAKTKISEGRKQLSSVRVIQRNLVYIVGLPLNLADEDLLQHKEYFGQYGKVLKVSISRTSAGTIQQFPNNTCSVTLKLDSIWVSVVVMDKWMDVHIYYILKRGGSCSLYSVHSWVYLRWQVLEPCTNPDCLYLHEIGSQEDSFSKDEIISAYSSRVQQITGIANNGQRRAGSAFPPPADDYCNNSSATTGKPAVKSTPNNLVSSCKVSPPSSSAGRAGALPAAASCNVAMGSRGSNSQLSAGAIVSSNGQQKLDAASASLAFSSAATGTPQASLPSTDLGKKDILNADIPPKEPKNKAKPLESKNMLGTDPRSIKSESFNTPVVAHPPPMTTDNQSSPPITSDNNKINIVKQSNVVDTEKMSSTTGEKNQRPRPDATSVSIDKQIYSQNPGVAKLNGLSLDCFLVQRDQGLQQSTDVNLQYLASSASKAPISDDVAGVQRTNLQSSAQLPSESENDFEVQRLSDAIVSQSSFPSSSHSFDVFNHLRGSLLHQYNAGAASHNVHPVNKQDEERLDAISSNGFVNNQVRSTSGIGHSYVHGDHMGLSDGLAATANIDSTSGTDVIESSIISNILSLDLDAWDDPLTSSQNLVNLLGEHEKQQNSFNFSSSWKAQNSQSRFSFARQEESRNHSLDVEPSYNSSINQLSYAQNREPYLDRLGNGYGIPQHNAEQYDGFGLSHSVSSSNKLSVPRSQISAPPGFSVPNRPPPGFSSHMRSDQTFDIKSGNHFLESTSSLRIPYQASPSGNASSIADIEFIDPAILAVGKGRPPSSLGNSNIDMGPSFSAQTSNYENDSRLQLLMQRSLQSHQNYRYADVGENYSPRDAYRFSSRHMEPSQISGLSSFSQYAHQPRGAISNGHWDNNWNEVMAGNNLGMAELLRNDRLGFNKLYGGYEESKFQMPGAAVCNIWTNIMAWLVGRLDELSSIIQATGHISMKVDNIWIL
ncbi:hypothetical protein V2J09_002651 [Rumex salicifolius]